MSVRKSDVPNFLKSSVGKEATQRFHFESSLKAIGFRLFMRMACADVKLTVSFEVGDEFVVGAGFTDRPVGERKAISSKSANRASGFGAVTVFSLVASAI